MIKSYVKRMDEEFNILLNEISRERVVRGIDNKTQTPRRLSKAFARMVQKDLNLKETLIKSPLDDDRRYRRKR
jgi:hypothetical protein